MMLTTEERDKMMVLLNDSDTPLPIKMLIKLLTDSEDSLLISVNRVNTLEGLIRNIIDSPKEDLDTLSYTPEACPNTPHLIEVNDPSEYPVPKELVGPLTRAAINSGLHLLTPMEAGAMLQGILIASQDKGKDKVLAIINMILIGQRIQQRAHSNRDIMQ